VTEEIPDREILSACLDILLCIASRQNGEIVTAILKTDRGTPIMVSASSDTVNFPGPQPLSLAK
jgi:hypothetical protein